jgi:hypothetical protein
MPVNDGIEGKGFRIVAHPVFQLEEPVNEMFAGDGLMGYRFN